jgi:hypothetical protein
LLKKAGHWWLLVTLGGIMDWCPRLSLVDSLWSGLTGPFVTNHACTHARTHARILAGYWCGCCSNPTVPLPPSLLLASLLLRTLLLLSLLLLPSLLLPLLPSPLGCGSTLSTPTTLVFSYKVPDPWTVDTCGNRYGQEPQHTSEGEGDKITGW